MARSWHSLLSCVRQPVMVSLGLWRAVLWACSLSHRSSLCAECRSRQGRRSSGRSASILCARAIRDVGRRGMYTHLSFEGAPAAWTFTCPILFGVWALARAERAEYADQWRRALSTTQIQRPRHWQMLLPAARMNQRGRLPSSRPRRRRRVPSHPNVSTHSLPPVGRVLFVVPTKIGQVRSSR